VSGLTPTQLDRLITDKLSGLVREPRVDVRVIGYDSKFASIFGEIMSHFRQPTGPGTYFLTGKTFLLDFISRYGGPTPNADLKEVEIVRGGKTYKVNLYRALFQGDLTQNIVVDDADVIFIPSIKDVANKVFVFGEVRNPGMYAFKSTITAFEAIALAGGFTKDEALLSETRIIRGDLSKPEIIHVNLKKLITKGELTQNVALLNNDILYVPRTLVGDWNSFIRQLSPTIDLLTRPFISWRLWQDIDQNR
jgi:polysaccharide export outer membrane protein